jgi:hypothetical protein
MDSLEKSRRIKIRNGKGMYVFKIKEKGEK